MARNFRKFYKGLGAPDWWVDQRVKSDKKYGVVAVTIVGEPWKPNSNALRPSQAACDAARERLINARLKVL